MSEYALSYTGAEVNELLSTVDEVADYIVAEGTSDIWKWRKWASGLAECWGQKSYSSFTLSETYGGMYFKTTENFAFPFTFAEIPRAVGSAWSGTGLIATSIVGLSETSVGFYLWNPTSVTISPDVFIHAVGRWK